MRPSFALARILVSAAIVALAVAGPFSADTTQTVAMNISWVFVTSLILMHQCMTKDGHSALTCDDH